MSQIEESQIIVDLPTMLPPHKLDDTVNYRDNHYNRPYHVTYYITWIDVSFSV